MNRFQTLINTLGIVFCIIAMAVLSQSCIHDKLVGDASHTTPSNTMLLRFSVSSGGTSTRTSEEDTKEERRVENIGVWGFDASGSSVYFRYFSSADGSQPPQSDVEGDTPDGTFTLSLVEWPGNVTQIIALANLPGKPEGDQTGVQLDNFLHGGIRMTRPSSQDNRLLPPLPMAYRSGMIPPGTTTLTGQLHRSAARTRINLVVDDTTVPGLSDRLQLERAQIYLTDLLSQSQMMSQPGNIPLGLPRMVLPTFYDTRWIPVIPSADRPTIEATLPTQYLCQQVYNGEGATWSPVGISLNIPYTDDHGNTVEDNYYRTAILTSGDGIDPVNRNDILPNRSYNITLRIVDMGNESLGMNTEISCIPWNTENHEVDAGLNFELSSDEFTAYADRVQDALLTTITAGSEMKGTIKGTSGIVVNPSVINETEVNTEVRITLLDGTNEGHVAFSLGATTKYVRVRRHPQSALALYSVPDVTALNVQTTSATIVEVPGDWLKLSYSDAFNTNTAGTVTSPTPRDLYAHVLQSTPGTTDRHATIRMTGTDGKSAVYYIEQKAFAGKIGFPNCNNQISRESERWTIDLDRGRYSTEIEARVVIEGTSESLTYGADATVPASPAGGRSISSVYTKRRWDTGVNTAANNGTRNVRVQIKAPNGSDWENTGVTGKMHDRNEWWNGHMFSRGMYHAGTNSVWNTVVLPTRDDYSEVHERHPFFGKGGGRWKVSEDRSGDNLGSVRRIWEANSNWGASIYGQPAANMGWSNIVAVQFMDWGTGPNAGQYVCYDTPNVNGTFGSRRWVPFTSGFQPASIPVKEYVIRPTDDNPIR